MELCDAFGAHADANTAQARFSALMNICFLLQATLVLSLSSRILEDPYASGSEEITAGCVRIMILDPLRLLDTHNESGLGIRFDKNSTTKNTTAFLAQTILGRTLV